MPFTDSETDPGLEPGSRVASYLIVEEIGRGGTAVVCRARDVRLNRWVALKILSKDVMRNRAFRERFIRESRAAAAVDHPNILPIFDADEADGVFYIAMRYVANRDVGSLIDREGPLPVARALSITAQVASALDAAHARGLVHRDVKPANILLGNAADSDTADHVYLADFGISMLGGVPTAEPRHTGEHAPGTRGRADVASRLTTTEEGVGTVPYASPEQILGRPLDGRADAYSLACAFFEMLSGVPPFTGEYDDSGWLAQFSGSPPALTAWRPDLPPTVDQVLAKELAVEPGDRYGNCRAFAAALSQACDAAASQPPDNSAVPDGSAVSDTPDGNDIPDEGNRPPNRRWRRLAIAAASVALLIAVGGAWALLKMTATPRPIPAAGRTTLPAVTAASSAPGPAATVESFISDINHLDYSAAWQLWGIRAGTTYQRFASSYATTARETLHNLSVSGDTVRAGLTVLRVNGAQKLLDGRFVVQGGVIVGMSLAPHAAAVSPSASHVSSHAASPAASKRAADCSTTATADISADCYLESNGTITADTTGDPSPAGVDGNQLSELADGDYLEYPDVNFGSGANHFTARVASGVASGSSGGVEVVLDNPDNKPVAGFSVGNTGGWSSWQDIGATMTEVTGVHNVYIVFTSGGPDPYVSLHYFNFASP